MMIKSTVSQNFSKCHYYYIYVVYLDQGGVLAFEPNKKMIKKAFSLHKLIKLKKLSKVEAKNASVPRNYSGVAIPEYIIDRCKEEEARHKRERKPKKRRNILNYRADSQGMNFYKQIFRKFFLKKGKILLTIASLAKKIVHMSNEKVVREK